ncbi:hypothetical protein AURDEDRAFT_154794 [Auricularia subglabra TFB-10046 SS5]|nr:hypothetical protein AURDEDRAFT_154794 [Auricularia subglabra TFB-10046 SS5]
MRPGICFAAVFLCCLQSVAASNGTLGGQERSIAQFLPLSWSPFRFGLKLDARQDGQCAVSCGGGLCCDVGLICCDGGGCCPTGFYCTAVGCCPIGKTCGDSLTPCPSDPSQLLCAGGNCCPPDLACASHDGVRTCDPPRSSTTTDVTSTGSSTSSSTISTTSATSTPPPSTTSSSPTSTFDAGGGPTFTPTPGLPASPPGITQTTVPSDDNSIIYTPSGSWTNVQEQACKGNQVKRSTTIDSELSLIFNGSAVALLVSSGPNGGLYEIKITDVNVQPVQTALVNGFSATQGCATGFATRGLARGIHTISVALKAASPNGGAALDVNAIIYWDEDTQPANGGSGTGAAATLKMPLDFLRTTYLACSVIAAFYLIMNSEVKENCRTICTILSSRHHAWCTKLAPIALEGSYSCPTVPNICMAQRGKSHRKRTLLRPSIYSLSDNSQWHTDPTTGMARPKRHDIHLLLAAQCIIFLLDMIASTTLVVRFLSADARRSTLVAVSCLTASIILIAVSAAVFSHGLHLADLSTTFWLAVAASIITVVVDVLLIWEFLRTRLYRVPLTRIAVKQRSLVTTFYAFVLYLTCGSIIFKFASGFLESYLDAAYFMVQSILTCGFGELTPPNLGSRLATILYFPLGIVFTGVLIAQMRNTVMETAKRKIMLKLEEEASPEIQEKAERSGLISGKGPANGKEGVDQAAATYEERLRAAVKVVPRRIMGMRATHSTWTRKIGALVFAHLEGFNYFMALYFCFIAFSSIGFGDLSPSTPGARAFYIGWGMMGIVCLTILFSVLSDAWLDGIQEHMRNLLCHRLKAFRRARAMPGGRETESPAVGTSTREVARKPDEDESTSTIVRDLHAHLRALLRRDHVNMRSRLRDLFEEQRKENIESDERGEEEELNDALVDDDDETIKVSGLSSR